MEDRTDAGGDLLARQWDRLAAWACVIVGAVVLLIGWAGVSGTAYPAEQIPFVISGGIGGVFFLGLGAMLWISADLHDEWQKLDRIEEVLTGGVDAGSLAPPEGRQVEIEVVGPAEVAVTSTPDEPTVVQAVTAHDGDGSSAPADDVRVREPVEEPIRRKTPRGKGARAARPLTARPSPRKPT